MRKGTVAVFITLLLCPSLSAAQSCWRGEPSPDCRSFWVTEYGIFWRLDGVSEEIRSDELYDYGIRFELGPMYNVGEKYALGGTAMLTATGETSLGLYMRLRYWMNRNWSIDISPGIIVHGSSGSDAYELLHPAPAARIVLNYADFVGLYAGVEQYRVRQEGSELDWYLGVHAASYPGAGLGLVFLVLGIIFAAEFGITGTH